MQYLYKAVVTHPFGLYLICKCSSRKRIAFHGCVTTLTWNVVQLPIGMRNLPLECTYITMLQPSLVFYNDTRKPMHMS